MSGEGAVRTRAARWVGEFVVIVVGILAALAVDGWVQSREDRELERIYLERLDADLSADIADIRGHWSNVEDRTVWLTVVLREIGSVAPEPRLATGPPGGVPDPEVPTFPVDSFPAFLGGALGAAYAVDPRRGTYDDMLSSGGLSVIDDATLREEIARYYALVDGRLPLHRQAILEPRDSFLRTLQDHDLTFFDFPSLDDPVAVVQGIPGVDARLRNMRWLARFSAMLMVEVRVDAEDLRERIARRLADLQ